MHIAPLQLEARGHICCSFDLDNVRHDLELPNAQTWPCILMCWCRACVAFRHLKLLVFMEHLTGITYNRSAQRQTTESMQSVHLGVYTNYIELYSNEDYY